MLTGVPFQDKENGVRMVLHAADITRLLLHSEIPRLTDLEANFSLAPWDMTLLFGDSTLTFFFLIAQRRMTLRMGIKEEEITFIKKFRFPPPPSF